MGNVTAETLTRAEIEAFRDANRHDSATWLTCDVALGNGIETTARNIANARHALAEIINARHGAGGGA